MTAPATDALSMNAMDLFLRGRTVTLTDAERAALARSISEVRRVPARTTLVDRGERLHHSTMLVDGLMTRYIDDLEGGRQVVAFHVAGDFVDLHGYPLQTLDHSIMGLTDVTIGLVPHDAIDRLIEQDAQLGRKLWFSTLLDAAIHREWLFRLGRLDAIGRVAHFMVETEARLAAVGLSDGRSFVLPITQTDLAEIVGLTPIHVNRVLRTLREEHICTFRSSRVDIADHPRLARLGQFDPTYLYLQAAGSDMIDTREP